MCPPAMLRAPVMTPLHSGKSGMSCATSIGPAQYMREEMLTPSPPPNWGQHFAAPPDRTGEMEFKDEVTFPRPASEIPLVVVVVFVSSFCPYVVYLRWQESLCDVG